MQSKGTVIVEQRDRKVGQLEWSEAWQRWAWLPSGCRRYAASFPSLDAAIRAFDKGTMFVFPGVGRVF